MSAKYYTILTETGKTKVANAAALGRQIQLTNLAIGDGDGSEYDPVESQTELKKENYRAPISHLGTDAQNPNWVIAEGMIPVDTGGWFVREVGLFDEDGDLFAIGKYPETYKPTLAEGTGRDLYIRFIMVVSNTETIDLEIDPTVAIATRDFVIEENKKLGNGVMVVTENKAWSGYLADPEKWTGDLASRFYILPADHVENGGGGILKIFGDAYQKGQDYRDLGVYFYQDQRGDNGYHGNGVFWVNSKVGPSSSSKYGEGNPDIGFSFQDGAEVPFRLVRLSPGHAVAVVGGGHPTIASDRSDVGMEFQGTSAAFHHSNGLYWWGSEGGLVTSLMVGVGGYSVELTVNGKKVIDASKDRVIFSDYLVSELGYRWISDKNGVADGGLIPSDDGASASIKIHGKEPLKATESGVVISGFYENLNVTSNAIDVSDGKNVMLLGASSPFSLTGLHNGVSGQEVTIVFGNSNLNLSHGNGNMYLSGGNHLTSPAADSTITLKCVKGNWYETSRSINS